ncbi:MAG: hypothetical protein JOY90_30535 [Bradyrhizobium sp.]|uniref:hypothetical protein n=1 Tax=Bradyrhizobium sp. TaxID=376 RepID=UPI001E17C011|nr:hypothetical protein [Bradyrhizobium sp.]MBV9564750.1 hypothetical protein [Bradyrhizobium sp.]
MRWRDWGLALLMLGALTPLARAQSSADRGEPYVPRLGDIMDGIQIRHIKLWYAGKAGNWDLAGFELHQLKTSLVEAALLYSGIPVTSVTTLSAPLQSVDDAIVAKDAKRFEKAYGELTAGCNSCHATMQRSFIAIRPPIDQPFGDQAFAPGKKE